MQKVSKQQGFTLIELIIVIVLLGILAVTAAPKFLNLQDDARDATLEGIAGSLETAASVVNGKALIQNVSGTATTPGSVGLGNSVTVTAVNGYPQAIAANIPKMIDFDAAEFGVTTLASGTDVLIYSTGFGSYSTTAPTTATAACSVVYSDSTGAGVRPAIAVNTCVQ
ncbi:type II secretion system protein [Alteromonas sp. P256]|uniref:type II secretion system protein n=1 Tax=Alteromonas sp. P256 TaxID=3117399 RepID=UPI002FE2672B